MNTLGTKLDIYTTMEIVTTKDHTTNDCLLCLVTPFFDITDIIQFLHSVSCVI